MLTQINYFADVILQLAMPAICADEIHYYEYYQGKRGQV
jgi:hypothetical protein